MARITVNTEVIREHLPQTESLIVAEEHTDVMGHMNVGVYGEVFARASRQMTSLAGVTEDYIAERQMGAFMLRNFSQFIAEAHIAASLVVYTRVIAFSHKRVQYMHFMVNKDTARLSATMEVLTTHADLVARRSAPFPPEILNRLAQYVAAHNRVDWSGAPTCGLLDP